MDKIRAGELRKSLTEAERSLWRRLRLRQIGGHKFRRQQLIGGYIVDFVCLEERLIVEVDGGQHSKQGVYDLERDSWLGKQGFLVLRFWNDEILNGIDSVKEKIMNELEKHSDTPHLNPPPQGGRKRRRGVIHHALGQSSPARGDEVITHDRRAVRVSILARKGKAEGLLSSAR